MSRCPVCSYCPTYGYDLSDKPYETVEEIEARGYQRAIEDAAKVLTKNWHRFVHETGAGPGSSPVEKFAAECLNAIRSLLHANKEGL